MSKGSALFILLMTVFVSPVAHAILYKCVDSNGQASFQENKCGSKEQTTWERETRKEIRDRKLAEKIQFDKATALYWKEIRKIEDEADQEYRNKIAREEMRHKKFISPDQLPLDAKLSIKSHLRNRLNDPESLKEFQWRQVLQKRGGIYKVWVSYQAKNAFNVYIRGGESYTVDSDGEILSVGG